MKKFVLIFVSFWIFSGDLFAQISMVDSHCTVETRNLYNNLKLLSRKAILFGHQDDLVEGFGWQNKYMPGRSDIKEVCGEYPAVVGWDLGGIEIDKETNFDDILLEKQKLYIKKVYEFGGINTVSWHCHNPVYPLEDVRSKQKNTIDVMFLDDKSLKRYKSWLDKVATYVSSLRGEHGELIPVIFRPFHESTGRWFWWGKGNMTSTSFVKLWRFTIDYLRDVEGVHNLIYAYSTGGFSSESEFMENYPGDNYVDLLGFDYYFDSPNLSVADTLIKKTPTMINIISSIAKRKNKVWAITETGYKGIKSSNWWTKSLYPILKNSGASYVLLWVNYKEGGWAVYPKQTSAADFKKFYGCKDIYFQQKIFKEKIYKEKK